MLNLSLQLRIYVHAGATDMRKSFDGLSGLVRSVFQADPLDGSLFLFLNRRRDRVKLLYWDRDGYVIWAKRLEQGTFEMIPAADGTPAVEIDATQLAMWLGGVSLSSVKRRKRYRLTG
jgi:transposase